MEDDGNLVLYLDPAIYKSSQWLWQSGTYNNPGAYAVMQADGNLVVYSSSGRALWNSGTYNHPGSYLSVKDDGNLVVYSSTGSALWQSHTSGITQTSNWNCTTRVDALGNPAWRVCLRTTVWHNGVHAGVLSARAVEESCAVTTGWVCPTEYWQTQTSHNGPWTGAYTERSAWNNGINTDSLTAEMVWNDPVISDFPQPSFGYCVYIHINTSPEGTFQYPGPVVKYIGYWAWYNPPPDC
jgi:hypothetical protein